MKELILKFLVGLLGLTMFCTALTLWMLIGISVLALMDLTGIPILIGIPVISLVIYFLGDMWYKELR